MGTDLHYKGYFSVAFMIARLAEEQFIFYCYCGHHAFVVAMHTGPCTFSSIILQSCTLS